MDELIVVRRKNDIEIRRMFTFSIRFFFSFRSCSMKHFAVEPTVENHMRST